MQCYQHTMVNLGCRYGETLIPDVWFEAKAVWEVKAADLSVSPVHCAATGLVDANKGVSIRFPRLVGLKYLMWKDCQIVDYSLLHV